MASIVHEFRGIAYLQQVRAFRADPLQAMATMREKHGDLVYFPWPLKTALVFHPDDMKDVLLRKPSEVIKGAQTAKLKQIIGNGLFSSDGDAWRQKRRLIGPVFHPSALAGYLETIQRQTHAHLGRWPTHEAFDLSAAVGHLAFDIAGELFFGGLQPELAPAIKRVVEDSGALIFRKIAAPFPLPFWLPTPGHLKFHAGRRLLDQTVYRIVAARRRSATPRPDFLGSILAAGARLTDREVRDEVVTLLIAGFETTSAMLAWTLHLLSHHPAHLAALAAEADQVGGGSAHTAPLLVATLQEALRLYPPSPLISRQAARPTELGGRRFAAGTNVVMSQYLVHRDERFWPRAAAFEPERFLGGGRPAFAYFPFSQGPRRCIGEELAYAEGATILALVLRRFRLELVAADRRPVCGVILAPDQPVRGRLVPRA